MVMMTKHDYYKGVERLLYSYPFLKANLATKENEIKAFEHDSIKGIDFDRISTSKTNGISHEVEDTAILNIKRIDSIKNDIDSLDTKIGMIDRALALLSPTQRKVIELKYFDKVSPTEICCSMNMSKSQVNVHKHRAIDAIKICFFGLKSLQDDCPILKYM